MSIEALSVAMNTDVGQSTRKLVLMAYANNAKKDGTAEVVVLLDGSDGGGGEGQGERVVLDGGAHPLGDRLADAFGGPGDEGDLAGEVEQGFGQLCHEAVPSIGVFAPVP